MPSKTTGERVATHDGGFNPTWQRHVAAYAAAAELIGPGRVLDLGCGIGHSYHLFSPRESVGLDIDPQALAGQDRETVVADMRELPFADGEFASVVSVQSLEHVAEPGRVVGEVARVLDSSGTAVFVTPNRLTLGRPDEIIDPYHWIEFDAEQLRTLCESRFGEVRVEGLFGSARYMELFDEERRTMERLLGFDPMRLRRALPRAARQRLYDFALRRRRRAEDPRAAAITDHDFELRSDELELALDVCAVCRNPSRG